MTKSVDDTGLKGCKRIMKKDKFVLWLYFFLTTCVVINLFLDVALINFFDLRTSIFCCREDQFADSIKTSLSLKSLLLDPVGLFNYSNWPNIFKSFYENNPYKEFTIAHPNLSIFHHPPLTFNYFQVIAISIKYGAHPYTVVFVNIALLTCLIFAIIRTCKVQYNFSNSQTNLVALIAFIGYPSLFAIDRGNFQSLFCSLFFIIGVLKAIKASNINTSIIFLALSLNIRPNISLALIPFAGVKPFKMHYLIKLCISSIIIFIACNAVANHLSPTYTLESFIQALNVYKEGYIIGHHGDGYNSSLHSFARIASSYLWKYEAIFYFMSFILGALITTSYIKLRHSNTSMAYIGCTLCMLFTPTFGDYHLLIFLMPIVFAINEFDKLPKVSYLLSTSALAIMAPKSGILIAGFTLNSLFNPLICLITLIALVLTGTIKKHTFNH